MRSFLASLILLLNGSLSAQSVDPYRPDDRPATRIPGKELVWQEEFNEEGPPDSTYWEHEQGFVRNRELQWYQPQNARCEGGVLRIEGKRESVVNPNYASGSDDWRRNRPVATFTSSCIKTRGRKSFQGGTFLIRARIDTVLGSWPAIWTLGEAGKWPANGEIDIMEFYRIKGVPTILANAAWAYPTADRAKWNAATPPLATFTAEDPDWPRKFHVWRMDWTKHSIKLYLDEQLINDIDLGETINHDGINPFQQPHYLLLNLAIGGTNGGIPAPETKSIRYEVDYVRVYQSPGK